MKKARAEGSLHPAGRPEKCREGMVSNAWPLTFSPFVCSSINEGGAVSGGEILTVTALSHFQVVGRRDRQAGFAGAVLAGLLAVLALLPPVSRADCVQEMFSDSAFDNITSVFPNWVDVPTSSFWMWECEDVDLYCAQTPCATGNLRGVTMVNYGTATGGAGNDIIGMSFVWYCNGGTAMQNMAYAGLWGGLPTWTWAGSLAPPADPTGTDCWSWMNLFVYTDIGPCPTDGATIELGPRYNAARGGVTDSCNCNAPTGIVIADTKYIRYTMKKADRDTAAPGDTVSYIIYYGKPGTTNPTTVIITDTQPAYTHLLGGSAAPVPDPGWDPAPVTPPVLRWTVPGLNPTGGATGAITFKLTVDWGNGDAFEAGSGDKAAPEGFFLVNQAHISWTPQTTCAPDPGCCSSNKTSTSVKRFMFWKIGDNDVLFQGRIGMPDDEMIYSIFMKNLSDDKTWWNVYIWDTVPLELNVWTPGYGVEDPCVGWTMTPTGCAWAGAGRVLSGARTVLTWKLDMPPKYTLEVRWKAKVIPSATGVCLNKASIMCWGRTRVVDGTGHSITPRNFTHEAPIVLRTTYISYVGWAGTSTNFWGCPAGYPSYFLSFYPLNKASTFALYKKWCCGAAPCEAAACGTFHTAGGVSPKIDTYAGDCLGGPGTDWETGCKAERAPARYMPANFLGGIVPSTPFNLLHKISSYGPVMWELSQCLDKGDQDADTYAGTTSLTFKGFTTYTYLRWTGTNLHDTYYFVNTDASTPTTVYVFWWDSAQLAWEYVATQDIFNNSQWGFGPNSFTEGHYRGISSDARLIPMKGYPGTNGATGSNGGSYNDFGTLAPNAANGNLVNSSVPAEFYAYSAGVNEGGDSMVIVQNVGAAKANYSVYRYVPWDTTLTPPTTGLSASTVGAAGDWMSLGADYVNPGTANGVANADNPHDYGGNYDASTFVGHWRLYKVVATSGTVQVFCGRNVFNAYSGGAIVHASKDSGGVPAQTGREFWVAGDGDQGIQTVNIFCPKMTMVIQGYSGDGTMTATYTTTDSDECVSFKPPAGVSAPNRRNYIFKVLAAGNPGDAICQYICEQVGEKFYTAPFLKRGIYYDIIAPPVVYSGQSFWITIVVMDTGGGTRTDYAGTTSFTSTDPVAKIEGKAMDTYNFTWNGCGTYCGVKVFVNVSFTDLGMQTIVAADTVDGSIIGVTSILVVGADVKLEKRRLLTVAASGDTVQFQVCWQNISSATAFSFMITDAVPMGTSYVPEMASTMLCWSSSPVPGVTVWYSTATSTTPPGTFTSVPGTSSPLANTRWLRWTIRDAYVNSSGCVCYKVSVN